MAMHLGPGGGEPELMLEINTTPLIDVMLVLLIMLIVTIPIQLHAVNLNMPVGTPQTPALPAIVKLDIDAQSTVYWQGMPLASGAELDDKLRVLAAQAAPPELHLRPDRASRYAVVASVLAATKRHGLTKIAVVGGEQFAR